MVVAAHPIIAPEGKRIILSSILVVLLLHVWLGYVAFPVWLVVLLLIWLYRDPPRSIPSSPLAVVSPVDGTVRAVKEGMDPFLKRESVLHISIDMSLTGGYTLRSMTEGKVMEEWRGTAGDYIERGAMAIWIQTDEGDDLVMVLHSCRLARLLHCIVSVGERIGQGQRCGHILLGATVELYLPIRARTEVKMGQRIRAGCDVIAELIHD